MATTVKRVPCRQEAQAREGEETGKKKAKEAVEAEKKEGEEGRGREGRGKARRVKPVAILRSEEISDLSEVRCPASYRAQDGAPQRKIHDSRWSRF